MTRQRAVVRRDTIAGTLVENQHFLALTRQRRGQIGHQHALADAGAARSKGDDARLLTAKQAAQSGRLVALALSHGGLRQQPGRKLR